MNTYEMYGRAKKVGQLVAVLRKAYVTAEIARMADEGAWQTAAEAAGLSRKPSETTRAMVIARLEELENSQDEPQCDCHQVDADQFDASGCPVHDAPKYGDNIGDVNAPPVVNEECPF